MLPRATSPLQSPPAPRGYHIRLDFRDEFHIEASEKCKYDFLELRDGPFGYSPLLGRHCGKRHPPMAESSSRFLWIMFKSDESIEYAGFRAVYEFFKPGEEDINRTKNYTRNLIYEVGEDEVCRIDVDISKNDGFMATDDIPLSYLTKVNQSDSPIDCTWVIYTPPKHRVYIRWREYEMTTPQHCKDSFLEAYDRTTAISNRRKQFCGGMAKDLKSASNHFYLRLHSANVALLPKFSALFTIFIHGTCTKSTFDCGDNTCVNKSLVCNDQVNCNFSWDEMFCKKSTPSTMTEETPVVVQYSTIILGIVGGIIITVICLSVCITCHQRHREETRRKNALKQEERNAIEMTTLLTRTPQGSPQRGARAAAAAVAAANHVGNNNAQVVGNHAQRSNGIRQASSQGQGQTSVGMGNATSAASSSAAAAATAAASAAAISAAAPPKTPTSSHRTYATVGSMERRSRFRRDQSIMSADYDLGATAVPSGAEHYPQEDGAFKRYLDVSSYSDEDLCSRRPSRGSRREIPAAVILERPITTPRRSRPLTASLSEDLELPAPTINPGSTAHRPHTLPRDRSPSPRPDVVQEERHPELRGYSDPHPRYHPDNNPDPRYHPDNNPDPRYHPDNNPDLRYLPDNNPGARYHPDSHRDARFLGSADPQYLDNNTEQFYAESDQRYPDSDLRYRDVDRCYPPPDPESARYPDPCYPDPTDTRYSDSDPRYNPRVAADAQSLPERYQVRRYSLETLISEKSDVWKPRAGIGAGSGEADVDLVLASGPSIDSADDLDRTYWSEHHPPARSYHEQPKVKVSPARRKSPKSPSHSRTDSYKRRKSAGSSNSPDIFYSRPNRGVQQHHPV